MKKQLANSLIRIGSYMLGFGIIFSVIPDRTINQEIYVIIGCAIMVIATLLCPLEYERNF